jgi:RNA polymerase sigma factor (sigma-70 family)
VSLRSLRPEGLIGRRAAVGDEAAFRELADAFRGELQAHCYRILGSVQDAEDLVQETLLAAWRGLDGFGGRASPRSWLYRIATNRCLNALRDRGRPQPELPPPPAEAPGPPEPTRRGEPIWLEPYPDALLEGIVDRSREPDARYETREAIGLAFVAGLQRLPPRQRAVLDLRDDHGRPVAVTPHRFRHTVATRMINNGVPQIAVQQLLDHESPRMTNIYARLHDQTLRAEFDRYQHRINIRGETVPLDPDGPLSDAAWAKQKLARAKQTLPNGYCGLPLQQSCPHPNACLTCDHFLTTEEFLPLHRDQLERTERLLADAEAGGNQRLVEMNTPVKLNLARIIEGLEALQPQQQEEADAA